MRRLRKQKFYRSGKIPRDEKNYPQKNVGKRLGIKASERKKKITTFGDPNNYFEVFAEIFPGFHVFPRVSGVNESFHSNYHSHLLSINAKKIKKL